MAPDYSKYFLSCENTNELRVMDAHADTLIKVLPVGKFPQELTISKSRPYIFVSCMEDVSPNAKSRGSVYVYNYNDYTLVKRIDGSFFQPHGICVDDKNGVFYIVSRNFDPTDNRPSHCNSVCGQRNGWYQVFDLNTLAPVSNKLCEVTPDPYFIDTRFK